MIHYSCDRCGCRLDPRNDLRYVVNIEVFAAMDPLCDNEDEEDRDHLLEIHEILERLEDSESEDIGGDVYQRSRHDLCPECAKKFSQQPVAAGSVSFDFSDN